MTAIDLRGWNTPGTQPASIPAADTDEEYTGRHRSGGAERARLSFSRMWYQPAHLPRRVNRAS